MTPEDLLDHIDQQTCFRQPKLRVTGTTDFHLVEGMFIITREVPEGVDDGPLGEFQVRIEIPHDFPISEPRVYETAGAISRDPFYHVNAEGSCCTEVWELWIADNPDPSFGAFLDGPVRNFFLSQLFVSLQDASCAVWPFGEWRHGRDGLIDAFAERLGCKAELATVKKFLKVYMKIVGRGSLPVYWNCPCQSGRHLGRCCGDRMPQLMAKISKEQAERMLLRLLREGKSNA